MIIIEVLDSRKNCITVSTISEAAVFSLQRSATLYPTECLEYSWFHLRSFDTKDQQRMFIFKFPAYYNRRTWEFSNFVFKTVEIRFACNNHTFQPTLLFHLLIFLFTGEIHSRLSSLHFLNRDFYLACVCVDTMLQSTTGRKAFFS